MRAMATLADTGVSCGNKNGDMNETLRRLTSGCPSSATALHGCDMSISSISTPKMREALQVLSVVS